VLDPGLALAKTPEEVGPVDRGAPQKPKYKPGEIPEFFDTDVGRRWTDLRRSPNFSSLTTEEQARVTANFFSRYVSPHIPLNRMKEAQGAWLSKTEDSTGNMLRDFWKDTYAMFKGDYLKNTPLTDEEHLAARKKYIQDRKGRPLSRGRCGSSTTWKPSTKLIRG